MFISMPESHPRLAVILRGLGAGGAERLVLEDVEVLSASYDVSVAYTMSERRHLHEDMSRFATTVSCLSGTSVKILQKLGFAWFFQLRRWIRDTKPDIIHVHSPLVAIVVRVFRKLRLIPTVPLVYTEHSEWQYRSSVTRILNAMTIDWNDITLCVSDAVLRSMGSVKKLNAEVLIHGVDVGRVRQSLTSRGASRTELTASDSDIVVGMMANFRPEKNHKLVFEVVSEIIDTYQHVHFVFFGQGVLESQLRKEIARLKFDGPGRKDRFHFCGYTAQPHAKMAGFDIMLLPSSYEGLPVVLMDSLCFNLPVVASKVGGIADFYNSGEAVLLEPPLKDNLRIALVKLLDPATGPQIRDKITKALQGKAEKYDSANYYARLEKIYSELLSR